MQNLQNFKLMTLTKYLELGQWSVEQPSEEQSEQMIHYFLVLILWDTFILLQSSKIQR